MRFEVAQARHEDQPFDTAGHGYHHAAFAAAGKVLAVAYGVVVTVNHGFHLLVKIPSGSGQLHIAVVAPEKLKAKLLFHVGNVLAHGSLGDKALFSRAGKIQTFCCADKIFQSSNIHKRASFCNRWKSKCNLRNYYNMIMIYCNIKNK